MPNVTSEEIEVWKKDPVTKEYFGWLNRMAEDHDHEVHVSIQKQDFQSAGQAESGLLMLRDSIMKPDQMLQEAQEDEEEEKNWLKKS